MIGASSTAELPLGGVLVTGGLGYLGGRVVAALAGRVGTQVRVLVHGDRPVPAGFPANVEIRRGEVRQREDLRGLCDGISYVVHLAGLDQAACRKSPADGLTVSGIGTLNVAEEAADAGVQRFLFVSSFHVYGEVPGDYLKEEMPLRPVTPYGIARAAGEAFARLVARQRGLSVAVLRLSNGYGPPAYPGTSCWSLLVNDLCEQAVRRGEIVLRGSGKDARDFVAMTDIVRALEFLATVSVSALGNGVVNIATGTVRTTLEVAECVQDLAARASGRQIPVRLGAESNAGPIPPSIDLTRARVLGFVPQVDFREEVQRTLAVAAGPLGEGNQ